MFRGFTIHWLISQRLATVACLALVVVLMSTLNAEDQSPAPEVKPPRIALCLPLGVPQVGTTKVTLRGWSLKDASEVTTDAQSVKVKVLKHGSASVPGRQKPEEIGDEQLELEVTLPESFDHDVVQLFVVTPAGKSDPCQLLVGGKSPVVEEVEPNDGFRQAQQIAFPQIVAGSIHADGNVDVFALELTDKQTVRITVTAAALGSNLDSLLTLYSSVGTVIAIQDDAKSSHDSQIETTLAAGRYLITLQDAHDRGGPAHPYQLKVAGIE